MTVTLELSPEEVAALQRRAEAEGVDIQTVLHRLVAQIEPSSAPETQKKQGPTGKQKGTVALMHAWRQENEADDPEELAEREREREEVEANLSRWRAEQRRLPAD